MGRRALAPGEGLYLPGTSSIHMLFMRFPIDCMFVGPENRDGNRQVVAMRDGLRPWLGVAWARGAEGAIELPAGTLQSAGIVVGDIVSLQAAPASTQ